MLSNAGMSGDLQEDSFSYFEDENGEIQIPISTSINQQKMKLDLFYTKIFGSDNSEQKPLSDVLDNRLLKLKNVEEEAKKIIGLSSNAGLAGGLVILPKNN